MIPKKIHYVWLGSAELPPLVEECIASWRRLMPDYEIIRWDESCLGEIESTFVKEALEKKKWAFASDYIRLHALYKEGGIYLDTDVRVLKPFDDLLPLPAFIGTEHALHIQFQRTPRCLTSYCMGCEPAQPYFKAALDYYKDRHFIRSNQEWLPESLRFETTVNSYILMEIAVKFGYDPSPKAKLPQTLKHGMKVFQPQYFNPRIPNNETYCVHLADGSWRENEIVQYKNSLMGRIRKNIVVRAKGYLNKKGIILIKAK